MAKESSSLREHIQALQLVEQAGFDATLTFVTQTLVTSWLYLKQHVAETGNSFDQLTAAGLIEEIRKSPRKEWPPIIVVPKA